MNTATHTGITSMENIYPGTDANTNKLALEIPENFIKQFEKLTRHARSNNIEVHLNDLTNRHILPKRDLENKLNNLETNAYKVFYQNLQNQKLQLIKEEICDNMQKHMFGLYASEIIPASLTNRFALTQVEKQQVKDHNNLIIEIHKIPKQNQKGKQLSTTDTKYKNYIKQLMKEKYFAHGLDIEAASIETIKVRLKEIGEEVQSMSFVQQQKKEIEDKQNTYKSAIQILRDMVTI